MSFAFRSAASPRLLLWPLALVGMLTSPSGASRAQDASEGVFPAKVEQVTVDVVVSDRRGDPVPGLAQTDFTIFDDGRPRPLTAFEVVDAAAPASNALPPAARPRVVTNQTPRAERGRSFVLVFDDIHMSAVDALRAKAAVAEFLNRGTQEGDRVTLVATGGGAWWSTRLGEGRADLLSVLKHLDGRRVPDNALERLTDYEAMRIYRYRDVQVAVRVLDRFERYGARSRRELQESRQQAAAAVPSMIDPYVESRAAEAYLKLKTRIDVTMGLLERTIAALADSRDRKAVLLLSEGFVYDAALDVYKRITEAARRANAALYFIDTRGLEGMSRLSTAEFGPAPQGQDLMSAIADVSLEGEGAAFLAAETGGFAVRNTNDLASGAARIGRESRQFYLLGFDPGEIPRDGRFHKLEVRVRRKDLVVRARRGYYATSTATAPAPAGAGRDPGLQRALDAPLSLDAIPLRAATYLMDEPEAGRVRVLVVAETDVSKVAFPESDGVAVARLDTLVVVARRESGDFDRSDQHVELKRLAAAPAGPVWYSFVREFALPAGGYQAKLVVRDAATLRIGSLLFEFEVPSLDRLRVSTPLLSDRLQQSPGAAAAAPALLVDRDLTSGGTLYCRFDVYGATRGKDGRPQVTAGHELRHEGVSLGRGAPSQIEPTSLGSLARMLQIPLAGMVPGDYELLLTVRDELGADTRELVEPFSIRAPARTAR